MSSDYSNARKRTWQFPALGSFWTGYGIFRLIMVLCLLIYGRTATLMFGALLDRVADPFVLMGIFHFLYTALVVLSAVCGIVGFVAGLALLGGHQSGRKLALIAAVLSLCDIPLGLTLGIYTLVELLPVRDLPNYSPAGQPA
jgi:hypothetical protein